MSEKLIDKHEHDNNSSYGTPGYYPKYQVCSICEGYINNFRDYKEQKLISEFVEDLTSCWTWINGKTMTAKSARIKEIIEKWEEKLK